MSKVWHCLREYIQHEWEELYDENEWQSRISSSFQFNLMRTSVNSIWQSYFALISHVKNNFQQDHLSTKQQKMVFRSLRKSKMSDNRRINIDSKSNIQIIDDFFWKDHTKDMNEHMIVFYVCVDSSLLRRWHGSQSTSSEHALNNIVVSWKWYDFLKLVRTRDLLIRVSFRV